MPDLPLHIGKNLPGINLIPVPVQVLGRQTELNDEVAGEILWLDLAALLPPEPEEGGFIAPMIIRASDPPMKQRRSVKRVVLACKAILLSIQSLRRLC